MVQIRKLDRQKGDATMNVSVQEAVQQVNQALDQGFLVVDETGKEQKMLRNALGIKEESKLRIHPPIAGG